MSVFLCAKISRSRTNPFVWFFSFFNNQKVSALFAAIPRCHPRSRTNPFVWFALTPEKIFRVVLPFFNSYQKLFALFTAIPRCHPRSRKILSCGSSLFSNNQKIYALFAAIARCNPRSRTNPFVRFFPFFNSYQKLFALSTAIPRCNSFFLKHKRSFRWSAHAPARILSCGSL